MNWILASSLIPLLPAIYVFPTALRILSVRRLRAKCTRTETLVLTYDDGPSPGTTPLLIDLLATRGVKATFFMKGCQVDRYPELVDLVAAAGHEIGSHSRDHLHAWRKLPWRVQDDVERGFGSLSRWAIEGVPFRPPYGKLNILTWLKVRARRAPLGWWTVDGGDTKTPLCDPSDAAEAIRASRGGVVLLHDLKRSSERNQFVLNATRELLDTADSQNLRVLPLGKLLGWAS